jgi:hypothetical protein
MKTVRTRLAPFPVANSLIPHYLTDNHRNKTKWGCWTRFFITKKKAKVAGVTTHQSSSARELEEVANKDEAN